MNILFVCTGNICRSPMAEGLFREEAKRAGRQDDFEVKSCGTAAYDGLAPSINAIIAARELGADVSMQQSCSCDETILEWADIVYCMAPRHVSWVIRLWPEFSKKVMLLDPDGREIEDPMGADCDFYRRTAGKILDSIKKRLAEI